jgi:PilZ domain-containing protein
MLEKRKSPRRKMVLPVKVSADNVTLLAYTVDITDGGARLGGLRTQLQLGTIVSLQRGSDKAKFRVAWLRELAPNELQAGVECLEPRNNFWGVNLSDRENEAKKDMQALMTLLTSNVSRTVKV